MTRTRKPYPRYTALIVLFSVLVMALFGMLVIAASASASAQTADDPIPTDEQNETEDEAEQLYDQLIDLDVIDVRFVEEGDDDQKVMYATLRWNGRAPESMTLTQIDEDSGKVAIDKRRLRPDEKIEVRLELVNDDPVLLLTEQGIEEQEGLALTPDKSEARETTLLRGTLIGLLVTVVGTFAMAWRHYNVTDEPQDGWED